MLRLSELTVRRGSTTVVEHLEWTVARGRPAWVVGPNGAGKSSLLRVIAGLDRPAAGAVRWAGTGPPPRYFHAETSIPGSATVGDWERLVSALLPPAARHPTALWPAVPRARAIGQLSTGERKRLLLDVLLRQPADALVLDEPYEHLSPEAKDALATMLEERAVRAVVIVATNQLTTLTERDGGLRLESGTATRIDPAGP